MITLSFTPNQFRILSIIAAQANSEAAALVKEYPTDPALAQHLALIKDLCESLVGAMPDA